MTTKSKVILGIIGAATAGVLIGMLMAPESGTDTRRKITRTAGDWAGHIGDLFANAKGELENLRSKGSRAASEAANRYSDATESFS